MTSQERVLLAIARKPADRIAIHDSPWGTTEARWHEEGMPEGVSSAQHFGFEFWGVWGDSSLQLPTEVLEETDDYIISTGDLPVESPQRGDQILETVGSRQVVYEVCAPRGAPVFTLDAFGNSYRIHAKAILETQS